MDELARRLREDAAGIDAWIPADLEQRIAASLEVEATKPRRATRGRGLNPGGGARGGVREVSMFSLNERIQLG